MDDVDELNEPEVVHWEVGCNYLYVEACISPLDDVQL